VRSSRQPSTVASARAAIARTIASLLAALLLASCGGSLPRPRQARVAVDDYVEVPFPPRPPPVEIVPPRPAKPDRITTAAGTSVPVEGEVVWADGGWEWGTSRYQWQAGGWVVQPPGATRTRWALVRRKEDGKLFFAPSRWRDASGASLRAPRALVRAWTRENEGVEEAGDGSEGTGGAGEQPPPPAP